MTTYDEVIDQTASGPDPLIPMDLSTQIWQEAPTASAALSLMGRIPMSSKTQRQPVLDVLPYVYWVSGNTGMKQTANQQWKNIVLVVEELACIVPIPENYLDDAQVPLWAEVRPRIVEAVGGAIDAAVFWGTNKPSTWGDAVYVAAGKSQQFVTEGTGVDLGQDVASLAEKMAKTGYNVNGFASTPGLRWRLVGLRSAQGNAIYEPDMQGGTGGGLYGFPLREVNNGSWDATKAVILMGDWTKSVIGVRRDISFKMFDQGVISDDSGKVILNLMQQDAVAMRMTMRLAYATVNPVTIQQGNAVDITERWPFGVILPEGASAPADADITQITDYAAGFGG